MRALLPAGGSSLLRSVNRGGDPGSGAIRVLIQAQRLAQVCVNLGPHVGVIFQKLPDIFPALPNTLSLIAKPGAALLDEVLRHAEVEQIAFARDALTVNDVEFRLAEWRSHLIFHYFNFGPVAGDSLAVLNG